jgi:hypothetical protein
VAAEIVKKHGLSDKFLTFKDDSYKTPTKFTSANEIRWMCKLKKEVLHDKVRAFMDKNCTHLKKNSTEYTMAFWQRVVSILKSGSSMKEAVLPL